MRDGDSTWLQFPSNINVTYNVHKTEAKGIVRTTITKLDLRIQSDEHMNFSNRTLSSAIDQNSL